MKDISAGAYKAQFTSQPPAEREVSFQSSSLHQPSPKDISGRIDHRKGTSDGARKKIPGKEREDTVTVPIFTDDKGVMQQFRYQTTQSLTKLCEEECKRRLPDKLYRIAGKFPESLLILSLVYL